MSDKRNKGQEDDPLLRQLNRMAGDKPATPATATKKAAAEKGEFKNEITTPGLKQGLQVIAAVGSAIGKVASVGKYVWDMVGRPIWNIVSPVLGWVGRQYRDRVWLPFAYVDGEQEGERIFSKKRASMVLGLTAAFAVAAAPVLNATAEGMYMATTMRTETLYLHTPSSHGDGTYSVKGCRTKDDCRPEDAVYLNVEGSLARHAWSIATNGTRFIPRLVVGPVAPGATNQCEVTMFGAPWEWIYEQFDNYPEVLDITCHRVGAGPQIQGQFQNSTGAAGQQQVVVAPQAQELAPVAPQ